MSLSELILKIGSIPENISLLEPFLQKVRQQFEITEEKFQDISLVLTEAVNNSIHHGNDCCPDKNVEIHTEKNNGFLVFTISDEGKGFDPSSIPDPTLPENVTEPNGRGVFLMRELSHQIKIHKTEKDCGCLVEVRFEL